MSNVPLNIVVPGNPDTSTGGYIYDRRIAQELEALGWQVVVTGLDGRFPDVDDRALCAVRHYLSSLKDGSLVIMDGLALSAVPELVAQHAGRLDLVALVHLPLCDEGGLKRDLQRLFEAREVAALANVRCIIVTSNFTARRLCELGVSADAIRVAEPGTDAAPLARGSGGPGLHLLCAATVTPRKRHDVLLRALAGLSHLEWTLTCVGDLDLDSAWAGKMFDLAEESSLGDRVTFAGVQRGAPLAAHFDAADLFVLASQYESFGMVFTEALACGLPIVATTGGAIPETVPDGAGVLVPPANAAAFGRAVASLMNDGEQFSALKSGAVAARQGMGSWAETGKVFESHVLEVLQP